MIANYKAINVLISSAGRRVELVKIWQKSVNSLLGNEVKIFACDYDPKLSPACYLADDQFQVPKCTDENYSEVLLKNCIQRNIKLIIPTIDTELIPLSKSKKLFLSFGIHILVSDLFLIEKCLDKLETSILFKSINIDTPEILDKNSLTFPCFMKPKNGNSSKGIKTIFSKNDLSEADLSKQDNIFQELVNINWKEFTLDLYFDKKNFLKACVPRQRLEVRNGEISKGLIKKEKFYNKLLSDFKYLKGANGVITLQVFCDDDVENYKAIEINPRFGGGYPLSHIVGAKFPEMIIKEYIFEEEVSFNHNWSENALLLRYDSTHFVC